ncbi:hypothetical protein ACROYT_G007071 [Oculina patagonica]
MEANIRDTGSTPQNETRRNQREIREMQQVIDGHVQRDNGNVLEREQLQRHRSKGLEIAIGLFIGGTVMLVMFVFLIIKPTLKDSQLKTAQCRVISSDTTDERVICDCGSSNHQYDCTSSYPCLKIKVTYVIDGEKHTAYLYKDTSSVNKKKCSTRRCNGKKALNDKYVEDFRLGYGLIGDEFTCYYNPERLDKVFATKPSAKDVKMTLVHFILWPSLVILLSVCIFIMYCWAKDYCCFKKKNNAAVMIP